MEAEYIVDNNKDEHNCVDWLVDVVVAASYVVWLFYKVVALVVVVGSCGDMIAPVYRGSLSTSQGILGTKSASWSLGLTRFHGISWGPGGQPYSLSWAWLMAWSFI